MDQHVHVLIADHEAHTRRGLLALLAAWPQIEVVGAAANGVEVIQLVEKCQPDVALMDILMPATAQLAVPAAAGAARGNRLDSRPGREGEEMNGLEAISLIKSRWPQVRIIVLTMYATHRAAALAAGANVFLLKGCPAEAIHDAILTTG